jgi:signal transduction histidine kinase/ligand-binding sensor domain-containing protein
MVGVCTRIARSAWDVGRLHVPGRDVLFRALPLLGILLASNAIAGRATYRDDPTYLIDTWETEDGLPENTATAMVQTPDGYLWFGTFNGLVRFDGVNFTVFNRANTPQLPSAGIVNLHLDKRGWLWVSTIGGMMVLADSKWRSFGTNEGWAGNYVRTFAERSNGDLLLTTFDGKVLEFANGRLVQLPEPPGGPNLGYLGYVDEMGQWWVALQGWVGRWDGRTWAQIFASTNADPDKVGITAARDGGMWLFFNNELRKYRNGTEVSRLKLPEPLSVVWSMFEDSRSNLWICTPDHGIRRVSPAGEVLSWTTTNGLSSDHTRFVFEDRENDLWVGTSAGGLQRFKPRRVHSLVVQGKSWRQVVSSVSASATGDLWVATYGQGLFRQSAAGVTKIALHEKVTPMPYLQSVLADRSGRVWVGTYSYGLWLLDKGDARAFPTNDTGGGNIIALFEDSRGRVWVSGGESASVYDGGGFRVFGPEDGLPHGSVDCFAEGSSGEVWLAHQDGVFRFQKGRFTLMNDESGRPLRDIACLRRDASGAMWMGSNARGLIRWREGRVATVGAASGLPAGAISSMIEGHHATWWMASDHGVMRVALADLQAAADSPATRVHCEILDMSDGLPGTDFSTERQPMSTCDTAGKLWFATSKGVAVIDPEEFFLNDKPPPTQIEEVSYFVPSPGAVDDLRVQVEPPAPKRLLIPAGSRRLEIHYAGLSFVDAGKVRFQAKLTPGDKEWRDVGARRVVYYYDLQPAEYVFRVRAANNDGVWNETGASLAFAVQPFFWQTWWFRLAALAALFNFGGLAAWWRARRRHQGELAELEKESVAKQDFARRLIMSQENERKRIAAELHDGLGQDLLLIKNRLALVAVRKADPVELTSQLNAAIAATVRAIGEVRTISHALRPVSLDQVGLTKAIEWTVGQLGESSATKFSAELDNIDGLLAPEMEIHVFRTIQEGLNNISRHAGAARAILEVKHEEAGLRVSLFDDGRGFDAEKPRHELETNGGLGLDSMEERIKYLGGSLELQSAPGRGTRITVRVPFPKAKG